MQAAASYEHNLITRRQRGAEDRPTAGRHGADRASGELDLGSRDHPGQRWGLAASPRRTGVDAGALPSREECGLPRLVLVPVRGAGGEIGIDHEREGAHAAEVVDDRRDGVVGDVRERLDAELVLELSRDHRLGAEALDHERERLAGELEHERRLAPGLVEGLAAAGAEQPRGGEGRAQRSPLAGVESVIVDARSAVRRRRAHWVRAHGRCISSWRE